MRNSIKIHFKNPEYIVDEATGVVVCKLKFTCSVPDFVHYASKCDFHESPACTEQTVKSVVFAKNNDTFDANIGRRVALAKAENQAYSYVNNFIQSGKKELEQALQAVNNFKWKKAKVKNHNIEYMRKF
jgi:hypothetical protein